MSNNKTLFNKNFVILSLASLLTFIAFYMMMPIIAMYVVDTFNADSSLAGVVVASYIITALLTRPFSGYLVDKYDRRTFYLIMISLFALFFIGYIISSSVAELIITRVMLGATFALTTTASNTLAIDVIPSERRAEGVGYFGAIIVLAMAIGPMIGLYCINSMSYRELFIVATLFAWAGAAMAFLVKTKPREIKEHVPMSWDRFFLREGASMAIVISLLYFLYGTLMVFVSLYIRESGLNINSGNFFMLFAIGIIISRVSSGKLLNRGMHNRIAISGIATIIIAGVLFTLCLTEVTYLISSILLGLGFGFIAPAIQSMLVDLVPANRRGTANSTYFIALDFGSGLGMLIGGMIAHAWSFKALYILGVILAVISLLQYLLYANRSYKGHLDRAIKQREV